MRHPKLIEIPSSRSVTDVFGGYNHNIRIGDGEFYDMKNLTSDYYPIMSPRGNRGIYINATTPLGLIAKDNLCYVDGTTLYINENPVSGLILDPNTKKTLVSMGAYIIILPDKKYVNTVNTNMYGSIEASVTTSGEVTISLCKLDGSSFAETITETEPETPEDKQYWIDTSSTPHTLKQYSSATEMWVPVATTYIKITSTGIGAGFSQYDGIRITGIKGNTGYTDLDEIDGNFVIWEKGDNYIVIVGMIDRAVTNINIPVTVKREMPELDFIIESENRLWGCRYGIDSESGEPINEIYASKLGDFKNWNCFMGLSTDSYVASVGTDGVFTGAYTYLGHPLFFKEGFVHKIYGNYPSNYQIQTTACRGVQRGCGNSLAMVNEILYYKGKTGICAYDGSLPVEISSVLGDINYSDAVACSHGNKYYISMKDDSNNYNLFVYDVAKGLWHKEDNTHVEAFCSCRNELYYIEYGKTYINTMFGSGTKDTEAIKWMAETGIISAEYPDRKYISNLNVRMALVLGARVSFYIQYDSIGDWEHICTHAATSLRSISMPIIPRRCDHFRIRICGVGEAKIYSITKTIEQGSDM